MKRVMAIIAVFLVICCSIFPCFALDQVPGTTFGNGYEYSKVQYLGLDSIEVYNSFQDVTQLHEISFFDVALDSVYAYPTVIQNNVQKRFFEYRPMRTINLNPSDDIDINWTETRTTFKGDYVQFHFSDVSLDLIQNVDFQMVELIPYDTNYEAVIDVVYEYTIVDYTGEEWREQSYEEVQVYRQSSAQGDEIIFLYPTFSGINKTDGLAYLKELTTSISFVRPSDSSNLKFYLHGKTEQIDHSGFEEYIRIIDYDPNTFNVGTTLLSDISSMLAVEIFPNFSLGAMLAIVCGVPLLIMVLKLFLGG